MSIDAWTGRGWQSRLVASGRRAASAIDHRRAPYAFIAPFYLFYLAFLLGPTVFAVYLSFHSWDGITPMKWIGLKNYVNLFTDQDFLAAARNTGIFAAAALFILCPLALTLAVALNSRGVRLKTFFRLSYFVPIVVSPLVISVMFVLIFDQQYGVLNAVVRGIFGVAPVGWVSTPAWAKVSIVLVLLWRYTGYIMIFFLAGLQNIPQDLYEAARVAGAKPWHEFRYVTLPLLRPVTAFISIVVLIGVAQIFEEPYILTQGGPGNATLSVVQFVYRDGLQNTELGYASAAAVVLFAAIFVLTIIQIRLFRLGMEEYQ